MICAHAQTSGLTFQSGRATVKTVIRPLKESDAHFYSLNLRKGQTVGIKVIAKGLFLSKENECSMFFQLFDGEGEAVFIGDDMVGIDEWEGVVEKTGGYKIKVAMSCIEGFTAGQLRKKKPTFKYSLDVRIK
jgi:hypothetical protein